MTMTTNEFTAFSSDAVNDGSPIHYLSTFTMPDAPTLNISVADNDATLSGDSHSDWSGQESSIQGPNGALGNGNQLNVAQIHWLKDDAGTWYGLVEMQQEGSGETYYTFLSDFGYGIPAAGTNLQNMGTDNVYGEWVSYDALGGGDVAAPIAAHTTGGEEVCLMFETFDNYHLTSSANVDSSDFFYNNGTAQTDGYNDGTMNFADVDLNGLVNAKITLDAGILSGSFEHWGSYGGDMFRIELVTDTGVIVLDTFTGCGSTLVGSETGQVLDCHLEQISYDLPAGLGNVSLRISSDISAGSEDIAIDNVKITAETPVVSNPTGTVSGRFTYDADQNDNEWNEDTLDWDAGVEGKTIQLLDTNGDVVAEATTDQHGNYSFDVPAGDYRVKFPSLDGYEFSQKDSGVEWHFDSDADANGLTDVISLSSGDNNSNVDAGLIEQEVEITLTANDDAITVMEDEAAGDVEGNVLANDMMNDEAYAGDVASVAGDEAAIGTWVEGSNGGKIKILADGSYDFDADGDFDALSEGQSAETTFTYQIAEDGSVVPTQNILFVLDVSNSTVGLDGENAFVGAGVGDVNGDGRADTVLDAQIAAAKEMIADMRAQGIDPANVNVGIVTFSGVDTTGASAYNHATSNSQTVGTFKLDDASLDGALDGVLSGSWTNYEAGLGEAEGWFNANANATDENVLYFLSDGRPVTGHDGYDYVEQDMGRFMDEVGRLEADFDASIYAVGVGENASMEILNEIDNSGDGAAQVSSVEELSVELIAAHEFTIAADTATITVTVQGQSYREANSDVIVVSESETSGDLEAVNGTGTSVLGNDITDAGAYNDTVATVNGSVTNVNATAAGSNGGVIRVNADGTVDFDAAGDFDHLRDGEVAETSFTYTIQGGEEATIIVQVNGETDYAANDDVIVVSELEGFGDDDGNVLSNDTEEGAAYGGDVVAVNGDAALVGTLIDGDNGGSLIINADGSFDFSADGDFDNLDTGSSETTTFTYEIEGGEMATVSFEVEGITQDEPAPENKVVNVAILLQSSSTMYAQGDVNNYVNDWADWNGNGVANEQMDMAYLMVADYMPEAFAAADAGGYDLNVSLVSFGDTGNEYFSVSETNWQGQLQAKISSDDSADYGQAFANATSFFDDVADADADVSNLLFFIGNGQQTSPWGEELEEMQEDHDVTIAAFMTDLEVNMEDQALKNLSSLDSNGTVRQAYADEASDAQGFGMAQNMLNTDVYLELG